MTTFVFGDPSAGIILIQPAGVHDIPGLENEYKAILSLTDTPFCLTAVKTENWNRDLSPWSAPAVFGNEPFGCGANETLEKILSLCRDGEKTYYIGGYSLAGLFSLWAAYHTDAFAGVAAASPSLWFPGFSDYMKTNAIRCSFVSLSLGDKEEKTRNPVMATVGDRVREAYGLLSGQGVGCFLEWNPGNHFREPELRKAKAFAKLLNI